MNVMILATRNCSHYTNLSHELDDLGVEHEVIFVEDHPELAEKYMIRHSPNLVMDGKLICRGQPSEHQLREMLTGNGD